MQIEQTGTRPESEIPTPPGATVRVLGGFYEGLDVPLEGDWTVIGRGRSADLVLAEPTISRCHAALGFDGESFFVQDLGSTNGTKVNGVSEPRRNLSDGDELELGKIRLLVRLPH
ncbi:FHA domain-containing protein [Myxococcota bacterium]|nr:FHA domain-containing protein [Myxococcota bacterium]